MTASLPEPNPSSGQSPEGYFATTHWSVVLLAGQGQSSGAQEALSKLCQTYWHPLYCYIRRLGYSVEDAQDMTQEFLTRLLEKNYLATVEREKGKFRSFLLVALKHFLANEWDRAQARKRGGGHAIVSLDDPAIDKDYQRDAVEGLTAEMLYDRRWALTLLDKVLAQLREEYRRLGKMKVFEHLQALLTQKSRSSYGELAANLKMSEGAVRVAVHRLRQRFRELLRAEIANTVASADQIDEELRHLFAVVSR